MDKRPQVRQRMDGVQSAYWRHYKGGLYLVLAVGQHHERGRADRVVCYQASDHVNLFGPVYYRRLEDFVAEVEPGRYRFTPELAYWPADRPRPVAFEPLPAEPVVHCKAGRDHECNWRDCPQLRDGEPEKTGRSCPLPDWPEPD